MGWDFGNAMSDATGDVMKGLAARRQAQNDAAQAKLKQGMDGTKATLDLADKIEDPNIKAQLYTHGVAPMVKLLTGYDPGTITPQMLQDPTVKAAIDGAHDLTSTYLSQTPDPVSKKPMSLNEYKLKMGLLFSASKAATSQFGPVNDMMSSIDRNVKSNIPGPGNTDTTGVVDPIRGTVTPLTNTATGQPTTSPPVSAAPPKVVDPVVAQKALDASILKDETFLHNLSNPPVGKGGTGRQPLVDVSGSLFGNLKRGATRNGDTAPHWDDFTQSQQVDISQALSTLHRLTKNSAAAGVPLSAASSALLDKLSNIKGVPGTPGAANPNQDALAYLASKHPELKNPSPADIAWAQGKLSKK